MKKIICLFLTLVMLLSAFVSCAPVNDNSGDDSDVTSDNVASEPSDSESESEPETEPEEEPIVMKDYDLSSFKIVCVGTHFEDMAKSLQSDIMELSGVELEIISGETADDGANEIIIGVSDREISDVCFDYNTFKYSTSAGIFCDGGKVQVLGYDRLTIRASFKYFLENVVVEGSAVVSLPEKGALCEEINIKDYDLPKKSDASYVRVISNNILMQSITDSWNRPVTENRLSSLLGAYALLDADIVGMQEVDALWDSREGLVEKMAKVGYTRVSTDGSRVSCPIYYKTDRFTVLDSGTATYDTTMFEDGPYEARSYVWACLEEKATGKQIVVVNTHLVWGWGDYSGSSEQAFNYRDESARQLVAFVEDMKTQYPNAVSMVMGDLNSYLESNVCNILGEALFSARDTAATTVNMKYGTSMDLPNRKPSRGNPPSVIDHIYYSKTGLSAKRYEVSISAYTYAYSDHVPVIVDFAFN